MSAYRFKVHIEDYDDLFRVIEIKASHSFEDLHFAILKAFSFDLKHPASFFYSDDLWHMEDEIAFKDLPYSLIGNATPMISTKLSTYIDDPHQRFIYVYRSEEDSWAFLLELLEIAALPADPTVLPRVVKSEGESPKQYHPKGSNPLKTEPSAASAAAASGVTPVPEEDPEPDTEDLQEEQLFDQIERIGKSPKSSALDLAGSQDSGLPEGFILDEGSEGEDEQDDRDEDNEEDDDYDDGYGQEDGDENRERDDY